MAAYKKNVLDTIVYTLHDDGLTAPLAHEKLKRLTGADTYTLEEVEDLYRRINAREFSLKRDGEDNRDWLGELDLHLREQIIQEMDVPSRCVFRKTCHVFRDLADTTRVRIAHLDLYVGGSSFNLRADDQRWAKYKTLDERRIVMTTYAESRNWERFFEGNFMQNALADLRTILRNPNLEVGKMTLYDGRANNLRPLLDMIQEHQTQIEAISLESRYAGYTLAEVLPSINPNTLKTIEAYGMPMGPMQPLNENVYQMPQWTNAKRLVGKHLKIPSNRFVQLAHFDTVYVSLMDAEPRVEDVMALKDALLANKQLNQIKLHVTLPWVDGFVASMLTELLPFKRSATSLWAEFAYPEDPETKLMLCVTEQDIWFNGPEFVEEEFFEDDVYDNRLALFVLGPGGVMRPVARDQEAGEDEEEGEEEEEEGDDDGDDDDDEDDDDDIDIDAIESGEESSDEPEE